MAIDLRDDKLSVLSEGVDVSSGASSINFEGLGVSVASVGDGVTVTIPGGSGGVTAVTGVSPVASSGGLTPAISMPAATGSVDGYLTSANWTTFNNSLQKNVNTTYTTNAITAVTAAEYAALTPVATTIYFVV
jgi:hypothetical protein